MTLAELLAWVRSLEWAADDGYGGGEVCPGCGAWAVNGGYAWAVNGGHLPDCKWMSAVTLLKSLEQETPNDRS